MKTSIETGAAVRAPSALRPVPWSVCMGVFFAGHTLLWADRSNFSVAAAAWAKQFDWTPSTIGLLLSAFSLGYLVMQPIGGWIADRFGTLRTTAAAMFGWSVWVLLTPVAPGTRWLMVVIRILLGMSEGPFIPAITAGLAKAVPATARRGRFSALQQSGAQLGPAAGVFFAGLILSATASPAMIFVVFGTFGIAFSALWWLYARRHADPAPTAKEAQTEEARARAVQDAVPLLKLATSKALWPLYAGYCALPYCQYIFLTWLPEYLTHYRHISLVRASMLSAFPFVAAFLGTNFCGPAMDWIAARGWTGGAFHRKFFIVLGALIYAVTTLIAANTDSSDLAIDMIIVANIGLAFYVLPFWTMVADIAPRQAGTLGGVMNGCGIVGATISPFVSGVIAQATGAFVAPLELAVAILVVAAIIAVRFIKVRPIGELVR